MATRSRFDEARTSGRCYVIAEAGSNHNGEWELASRLVETAASAGADAVKFQLFRADRLYASRAGAADYLETGEEINELVRRMELPVEWLPRLARLTAELGLDLLVTPFDEEAADAVDPHVPVHKLASYELTHEPLVRHVASKGKPVLMSTGAGTIEEVARAVDVVRDAGAPELVLLQCTAAYPARLEALNVGALVELRERFGVRAGLSDHSVDAVIAPLVAVGAGAAVIEKHFTLDRSLPGPDHRFALEPSGLAELVARVRAGEAARGSGRKLPHPDEQELRSFARRSIFALREIRAGERLDAGAIGVLRHGKRDPGLPPSEYPRLIGKLAVRDIRRDAAIIADDVEA